jgi:hypothetical protein
MVTATKKRLRPPPFHNPPPLEGWEKLGHGALTAIVAVCLIGGIGCFVAALLVGIWVDGALAENLGGTAVVLAATGMFLGRAL